MARRRAQHQPLTEVTDLSTDEPDDLDDVSKPAPARLEGRTPASPSTVRSGRWWRWARVMLLTPSGRALGALACLVLLLAAGLGAQLRGDLGQRDAVPVPTVTGALQVSLLTASLRVSDDRQHRDASGRRLALLRLPVVNHTGQPVAVLVHQVAIPHVAVSGDPVPTSVPASLPTSSSTVVGVPVAVDCSGLLDPPLSEIAGVHSAAIEVMLEVRDAGSGSVAQSLTQPLVITERWSTLGGQLDYACGVGDVTS